MLKILYGDSLRLMGNEGTFVVKVTEVGFDFVIVQSLDTKKGVDHRIKQQKLEDRFVSHISPTEILFDFRERDE